MSFLEILGFQSGGWGRDMLVAARMTLAVAGCGFLVGILLGVLGAAAKLSPFRALRFLAGGYTTLFRGVPDLLVVYLFYFGSSSVLSWMAGAFGVEGFVGAPAFLTGSLALGVVSGAYLTEVFRGACLALPRGQIEAARAMGMDPLLTFRRIILPQAARFALPGLDNVWQMVLKQSALVSVIGLVELMRQAQIGSGSTRQPFSFYLAAGACYLLVTSVSNLGFHWLERRTTRGIRRAL